MKNMSQSDSLFDQWATLRASEGGEVEGISVPSIKTTIDVGHGNVRLAVGPHEQLRLLIPVSLGESVPASSSGKGIEIRDTLLAVDGVNTRFIDILCALPELEGVFVDVSAGILDRLKNGTGSRKAVVDTLDQFRQLLAMLNKALSMTTRIGLLGELWFLDQLVGADSTAIRTWLGPEGERHDFRGNGVAVEVKASVRTKIPTVKISSIDQLAAPDQTSLNLQYIALERDPSGQIGFSRLFDSLAEKGVPVAELDQRLRKLGHSSNALRDDELNFSIFIASMYRVDEGFPRLVRGSFVGGDIPGGVMGCEYAIDLIKAEPLRLSDGEAAAIRRKIISS
jgi:hypothetical protein